MGLAISESRVFRFDEQEKIVDSLGSSRMDRAWRSFLFEDRTTTKRIRKFERKKEEMEMRTSVQRPSEDLTKISLKAQNKHPADSHVTTDIEVKIRYRDIDVFVAWRSSRLPYFIPCYSNHAYSPGKYFRTKSIEFSFHSHLHFCSSRHRNMIRASARIQRDRRS